jgi:hypothetical protein
LKSKRLFVLRRATSSKYSLGVVASSKCSSDVAEWSWRRSIRVVRQFFSRFVGPRCSNLAVDAYSDQVTARRDVFGAVISLGNLSLPFSDLRFELIPHSIPSSKKMPQFISPGNTLHTPVPSQYHSSYSAISPTNERVSRWVAHAQHLLPQGVHRPSTSWHAAMNRGRGEVGGIRFNWTCCPGYGIPMRELLASGDDLLASVVMGEEEVLAFTKRDYIRLYILVSVYLYSFLCIVLVAWRMCLMGRRSGRATRHIPFE